MVCKSYLILIIIDDFYSFSLANMAFYTFAKFCIEFTVIHHLLILIWGFEGFMRSQRVGHDWATELNWRLKDEKFLGTIKHVNSSNWENEILQVAKFSKY